MKIEKTFGETVKKLREEKKLTLREVAEALEVDTSMLGKIEKNSRKPNKLLIENFAKFFDVEEKDLTISFLSDTVAYKIFDEDYPVEVLKVAEEKVQYLITKKNLNP
jgi:transcriptional regulator with XRE-family HTH domain